MQRFVTSTLYMWNPQSISYLNHNRKLTDSQKNSEMGHLSLHAYHTFSLTIAPPPMSPPIYFTSSVMWSSLVYWVSPSGKNRPMFKAMDSTASGYRARATKREHFPVHMVFLLLPFECRSSQTHTVPPEAVQRKEGVFTLEVVGRFWVWEPWRQADKTDKQRMEKTVKNPHDSSLVSMESRICFIGRNNNKKMSTSYW